MPPDAVTMHPIGGSQGERYLAMAAGIVDGVIITPPLDVRAKNEGFNVLYRLIDLNLPFIYSSLETSHRMLLRSSGGRPADGCGSCRDRPLRRKKPGQGQSLHGQSNAHKR